MKQIIFISIALFLFTSGFAQKNNSRQVILLEDNWHFINEEVAGAEKPSTSTLNWETVTVPHDWAIKGPFNKEIDKQMVRVRQDLEKEARERTGRTGALPHIGTGWYRKTFELPEFKDRKKALLVFDGAMSDAQVYVNGEKVGNWPFGYNYFYFDISKYVKDGENILAVRLENLPFSSRWYPGAGIYRKVQVIIKDEVSFKQWGTFITTPFVAADVAKVNIKSEINGENVNVVTEIKDADGNTVASKTTNEQFGNQVEQNIAVPSPIIWDIETPYLYTAHSKLFQNNELKDELITRFGIREVVYERGKGLILNGEVTKFKGVCLHHDLGPLGAAVNKAALKRQLTILKDMGCNAVRSSHNMPSHEQLELCDEMGFLFLAESFDEWAKPKVKNGYNRFFEEWAEKDVVNFVRATRNHPSIVMWSSGNEVPDQWGDEGVKRAKWLQDIFHREDPTRPVTVGMDQVANTLKNGFGAIMDIPGLNYRLPLYGEAFQKFPQGFILGSETASTVSSRGIYKFPVEEFKHKTYDDFQSSSYDLEACNWSNIPDDDFIWQDDFDWVIGEFVWTGFDYLGEPTPYNEAWPSRSSYFGICDLAGIPKDRYYLYRSRWNTEDETLHILPHWNWEGREGEITPVFVYTNYNSAELFVNGVSQGIRTKNKDEKLDRYRLRWMDVKYEPGTIKVVAFDDNGKSVAEKEVHTAGKPHHLELSADKNIINADGKDLSYITVSVVDKDGNFCPNAANQLNFEVSGAGKFKVVCNGDATSLEMFHLPTMKAFSGKLVVTVQALKEAGDIVLKIKGKDLITGEINIRNK
ncbi:MAG: glycoside hydrolase family 2 protein [Prolixibacteraceae bacterium]|jgi:beta-galactosidase|nr:glycoside hydrolase family 2 protein [Prolixibacteraceae bacterium]MBT6997140.1 glycoside hydrolase family 2 protein [Prolixibacteraceae bacterium]MBT7393327.1 glycoside hydrolase family 2 protein [Prolixibacteraceae bacterium]